MTNVERRQKLALHLRHLSVGQISNDEFEESVMDDVSDGWLPEQYYRSKQVKSDNENISYQNAFRMLICESTNDTIKFKIFIS